MNHSEAKGKRRPTGPYMDLSTEDRLKVLANLIIDRILEEEQLFQERLKTDSNAKRIFENCDCEKCKNKKTSIELSK